MQTLDAIVHAKEMFILDDEIIIVVHDQGKWEVRGDELDTLVERGWITLPEEDQLKVTPEGVHQLNRWRRNSR